MHRAIAARTLGDDYQARVFWLQACRLFEEHSSVVKVAYEHDHIKSFDDVVVYYDPPIPDERGTLVHVDLFQVKYHVSQDGTITWQDLIDPGFINATSTSFLQRMYDGWQKLTVGNQGCRFYLWTPWRVDPQDPLRKLVSSNGGELHLHRLFDGRGSRSEMGIIRKAWSEHLGLENQQQLRAMISSLRIQDGADNLQQLDERLNIKLRLAGLKPVTESSRTNPYVDLARSFVRSGTTAFTRDTLEDVCWNEGLWTGRPTRSDDVIEIGIRSFIRWAEYLEDETEYMLDLVKYFEGRRIREPRLWQETVVPEVENFLTHNMRIGTRHNLHLDVHSSIAFLAGYYSPQKSGLSVVPVQRTREGEVIWRPDSTSESQAAWSTDQVVIRRSGTEVALAISVTHNVLPDVKMYIERHLENVRSIIVFAMEPQPSPRAIKDGTHALDLAESLTYAVREAGRDEERVGVLHVFSAAPNGFVFFLGQSARALGKLILYEYDFDSSGPGDYTPSFRLPV